MCMDVGGLMGGILDNNLTLPAPQATSCQQILNEGWDFRSPASAHAQVLIGLISCNQLLLTWAPVCRSDMSGMYCLLGDSHCFCISQSFLSSFLSWFLLPSLLPSVPPVLFSLEILIQDLTVQSWLAWPGPHNLIVSSPAMVAEL